MAGLVQGHFLPGRSRDTSVLNAASHLGRSVPYNSVVVSATNCMPVPPLSMCTIYEVCWFAVLSTQRTW